MHILVTLAKNQSSNNDMTKCNVLSQKRSLEETVESIMQHEKSAASVLCHLTRNVSKMSSARNVIGVLATLGHVDNINLSRLVDLLAPFTFLHSLHMSMYHISMSIYM